MVGEVCGRDGVEQPRALRGTGKTGGYDVGGIFIPQSPSVRGRGTLNICSVAVESLERATAFSFLLTPLMFAPRQSKMWKKLK